MEPRPLAGKLLLLLVTCLETIWSLLSPALVTPPKKKETYTHTNKQNPFLFMEGLQFSCNNRTKAVWGNKEEECGQTRVCCCWLLWSPMMGGHGFPGAAAAKLVGAAHHMSSFTCWAMQQRGFGLKSPSHKPTWNNFTILQVKSEFLSPFFACRVLISAPLSYRQLLILIYIIKSIVSLDQKFLFELHRHQLLLKCMAFILCVCSQETKWADFSSCSWCFCQASKPYFTNPRAVSIHSFEKFEMEKRNRNWVSTF